MSLRSLAVLSQESSDDAYIVHSVWGSSIPVRADLAWELEGRWFKSSADHSMRCGPVAGEVPVHLLGAAEPLLYTAAPSLCHLSPNCMSMGFCVCMLVFLVYVCNS